MSNGALHTRIVAASAIEAVTAAERFRLENNIELAIAFLDALDPDPDLDGGKGDDDCCPAGDDDPASSQPAITAGTQSIGDADDAEDAEDGGDAEPSLGWTECGSWYAPGQNAGTLDLEDATADAEPSDGNDMSGDRLTTVSGGVPL